MTARVEQPSPLETAVIAELQRGLQGSGPPWLTSLREQAADWFSSHGFPGRKDEAWRFTSLKGLSRVPFPRATTQKPALAHAEVPRPLLGSARAHQAWLLDGQPSSVGDTRERAGLQMTSLVEGVREGAAALRAHLGRHATTEHGFAALNTALFHDGLFVRVPARTRVALPLELTLASRPGLEPAVDHARVLLLVERDAHLQLLESHAVTGAAPAPFLSTSVFEIVLEEGATLEHVRLVRASAGAHRVALIAVHQGSGSQYTSRVFTFGGSLSRLDLRVLLAGEHASATLDGFYFAAGTEQVDHHTVVDHTVPRCSSREGYRGIVDDAARAIFDGTVLVRPGASGTDAHQENHNLILSQRAEVNSKPHLEIEHDDVRCSHGASIGRLDGEQVFYLRSRGLDEQAARSLVAEGFGAAVIDRVSDASLRQVLRDELLSRLAARGGS